MNSEGDMGPSLGLIRREFIYRLNEFRELDSNVQALIATPSERQENKNVPLLLDSIIKGHRCDSNFIWWLKTTYTLRLPSKGIDAAMELTVLHWIGKGFMPV